jgi:DNA polymerase I-like protein with 3'-5' exonuclease and polymerase domains
MALLAQYHAAVPYAKDLSTRMKAKARKVGYVKTWDGRRCRFPKVWRDGRQQFDWTEKAMSRVIQGTAAGQMRKAMVDADAAGHRLQLQVHDELNKTSDSHADGKRMTQIMVDAMALRVPMVVDMEWGPSWGELKVIE